MSLKEKTITGAKWTIISSIVVTSLALLKIAILTRFLDKSDFGLMALVTFVLGFTDLFMDMGLTSAILHKQNISKNEYASLYWLNFGFSFVLFAVILLITPFIAIFYSEKELATILPIMGISLIISAIGRQFKTMLHKELHFKFIAIVEILASIISLVFASILAVKGFGVYTLVFSALLLYAFSNLIYFFNGLAQNGLKFHFSFVETKSFLKIGLFNTGGQILNYFNRSLDILIIGKFFGTEILGGYSLAKELVFRPTRILNPIIMKVASPYLAKLQSNKEVLKKNYLMINNLVASVNIPVYFLFIVLAQPLVELVYGAGYDNISNLVRILSIYMIFIAVRNPIGSLIIATGKTYLEFYWFLFSFPVIPIAIIISAQFSIEWVAFSMVISMVVLFVPFWKFVVNKMIDVSLLSYVKSLIPSLEAVKYMRKNVNQI